MVHTMPELPKELVRDVLAGDRPAMGELYRLTFPAIDQYMKLHMRFHPDAEDMAQSVFVRLIRRIDSGEPLHSENLGGMLFTIGRNLVVDHYKSGRTRNTVDIGESYGEDPLLAPDADAMELHNNDPRRGPVGTAENNALRVALRHKLSLLTPQQRKALTLRYLCEMGNDEVADAMGIATTNVKALVYRGLNAMARNESVERERGNTYDRHAVTR